MSSLLALRSWQRTALIKLLEAESPSHSRSHVNNMLKETFKVAVSATGNENGRSATILSRAERIRLGNLGTVSGGSAAVLGDALLMRWSRNFTAKSSDESRSLTEAVTLDKVGESDVLRELEQMRQEQVSTVGNGDSVSRRKPVVLLGHLDTVHEAVEGLRLNPIRKSVTPTQSLHVGTHPVLTDLEEERIHGPGSADMKGGIVSGLAALQLLNDPTFEVESGERVGSSLAADRRRDVWFLLTPDEEIGSRTSRGLVEAVAKVAAVVFVLEPAAIPSGAVKTARKGCADMRIRITGRPAHAGNNPDEGINAVVELAKVVTRIQRWGDSAAGTSATVTMFHGGSVNNTVPDNAEAYVDCRVSTNDELERLRSLASSEKEQIEARGIADLKLEVSPGLNERPPMQRDATMQAAFARASKVALSLGLPPLEEAYAGGGSDGNFTAAVGCPTLDGLGPLGWGLHANDEYVSLNSMSARALLIAGLLNDWDKAVATNENET